MNHKTIIFLLLLLTFTAARAADTFEFHGFVTQGYIKTNKNNYFGDSTRGSFDFRELGISADWQPSPDLRFSTLLLSRNAGNTDTGKIRFDHALVDWKLAHYGQNTLGLIVGRAKLPIGLFNETRDVASTRPSILLPQSIYFDNARRFLINMDGVLPYYDLVGDTSYTRFTLLAGKTPGIDNAETEAYFLGADFPGKLSSGTATGFRIYHENFDSSRRLAIFVAHLPLLYDKASADILANGKIGVDVAWISASQDFDRLTLTTELFLPRARYSGFGPVIPDKTVHPLGWYGQISYRPNIKWETFARYDLSYHDRNDRSGEKLSSLTGRPAYNFYAKDYTIGARYHLTPRANISAEVHFVDGTSWLPVLDNPNVMSTKKDWTLSVLQFNYTW